MKDVIAELRVGVKDLAAEDRDHWSALARSDRLRDVVELRQSLEVELVRTIAGWDRHTDWAEDGAVTPTSWLKNEFGMTGPEAAGLVRLARVYDEHEPIARALDGGEIDVAHVRVMGQAERRNKTAFGAEVEAIVGHARTETVPQFTERMVEWADQVDEREPEDYSKRKMKVSRSVSALTSMWGPNEDADLIEAFLDLHDRPDPIDSPDGPRSREQRRYDLMMDLVRKGIADELSDDPMTAGNVDVIVDADVAAEVIAEDPEDERLAPYRDDGTRRRCEHPDGTRARRALVAAMLCTGIVRRVIIDPVTGQTLDVGRAHRRFTKRQVRALAIRDGGCAFPGCDRKPKWCDAHHLKPWEDFGPTDLDNGCLLCRRHHTKVHHEGWRLERDPRTGIFTATSPTGRVFTRRPGERR